MVDFSVVLGGYLQNLSVCVIVKLTNFLSFGNLPNFGLATLSFCGTFKVSETYLFP
jgi:hypothetical protein